MSEVLAQLEKKGGDSGELFVADFTAMPSAVSQSMTMEKSTPNIKKLVVIVCTGMTNLQSVAEFDVENTTITETAHYGNNWYSTYYQITLNGNQMTVRQTFTGGGGRLRIFYI